MGRYVVFGAGAFGKQAADFFGIDNISFYIDNSLEKQKELICGCKIYSLETALKWIRDERIIVAVSKTNEKQIINQLEQNGISNFTTLQEEKAGVIKKKLEARTDYIEVYNKAINWIKKNTIDNQGIITTTDVKISYPEVSGYYIPTLLRWGYEDIAIQYAKWLCSIQHENGAWYDTENVNPYIFDTAQILKGLLEIRTIYPNVDENIKKGCDWILSNMSGEGRLISPLKDAWGDEKTFSELIHTYCISPIKKAGELLGVSHYIEKAELIANYYTHKCKNQIIHFDLLSHFYAYVMEAMLDIGREDLAIDGMNRLKKVLDEKGYIPAYNNVDWVCSTGMFQMALVWYRLGDIEYGNRAFEYACKLQNETGGWYGGYATEINENQIVSYFPEAEISWAVKYFLDALYYRNLASFENQAHLFCEDIEKEDGRYELIKRLVESQATNSKILDVGCGKGRYLKNLTQEVKAHDYYAVDISVKVMDYFSFDIKEKKQGSLSSIPYNDNSFDFVYTCEALEHSIDIISSVKELCRVTKTGGKVAIIDKNKAKLGMFEIDDCEQWFDIEELSTILRMFCDEVEIEEEISYDGKEADGLFCCWIGKVK